ncbi:MAG: AAC(3) family N-acetyltransferase [Halanaerobiales bacterium]|nr:AAC(3) family N-acetyltransferase [Halanaerobiales bacterium]
MGEKEIIERSERVYTRNILKEEFKKIGLKAKMTVIVHSSLSSIGWISGGPVAVIQALMDIITEQGNIVMPAHSGDYTDPENWSNPPVPNEWIEEIRAKMPAFQKEITPTRGIGIIPEIFRTFPDVKRSYHPAFSFTARGKDSDYITKEHGLDYGFGTNSPLGKVYELDGSILLLGVNYDRNTSFHLSEILSQKKEEFKNGAPVLVNGKRVWKEFKDIVFDEDQFNQIGSDFEKYHNVKKSKVGQAETKLFNQRKAVDFAKNWIIKNS